MGGLQKIPTASITQSGWATVKLGIDLGEVFSKAPEQANFFARDEDRDIVQPLRPYLPLMLSLRRQIPLPDVYPLESGIQSTGGGYRRNIWNWWLGEVELTFNPSFYPSLVRMPITPMAGRPPTIAQSAGYRRNIWNW
jgi:hypothetical protein